MQQPSTRFSGKVFVNNVADRTVSVIEPGTFDVVRTIYAGAGSTGGTISAVHRRYYLPNAADNRVSIIDTREDRIVALVTVGRGPSAVTLSAAEDAVYVLNREDASVSVLDPATSEVIGTLPAGSRSPFAVALHDALLTMNGDGGFADATLAATPLAASDTALATEYIDSARAQYTHTANPLEARLVADGLYGDTWRRTMHFFRVWTTPGPDRSPVCQFSSPTGWDMDRVYAATAGECEALKRDLAWTYEGVAYYVMLPNSAGECSAGTEPLFRLYNGSRNGTVGHRYVREPGVRDTMVGAGWIAEGQGPAAVFACVPALRPQASPEEEFVPPSDAEHPNRIGLLRRPG